MKKDNINHRCEWVSEREREQKDSAASTINHIRAVIINQQQQRLVRRRLLIVGFIADDGSAI